MPCAQGWVCQGFVQPARYLIFRTCMPVSGSSISGIEGSSTPSWGIGNGTHSWVLVSMAVSSTGFSSSDMGDHFLLASRRREYPGPTFHYRERPGRGSSLQACSAIPPRRRAEGEAAFEPRSWRPRSSPAAISPETIELITRLRKDLCGQGLDAGPHTIAWHLGQHHQVRVSAATISRYLARRGLVTPDPAKWPRSSCIRFAAELPNESWQ